MSEVREEDCVGPKGSYVPIWGIPCKIITCVPPLYILPSSDGNMCHGSVNPPLHVAMKEWFFSPGIGYGIIGCTSGECFDGEISPVVATQDKIDTQHKVVAE